MGISTGWRLAQDTFFDFSVLQEEGSNGCQDPSIVSGIEVALVLKLQKIERIAKELGAIVLDPNETDVAAEVKEQTNGEGVNVAIECIGKAETVNTCIQCARRGGKVVVVGIFEKPGEINYNYLIFEEKELVGSLAYNFLLYRRKVSHL